MSIKRFFRVILHVNHQLIFLKYHQLIIMWELIRPIVVDFNNPVVYAIPVFVLLILIEAYVNYKERSDNYILKDSIASISMGIGSVFIDILTKSVAFAIFGWIYLNYGIFNEVFEFTVLGWAVLFFLDDFTFYWLNFNNFKFKAFFKFLTK